jgi:hypothetical protein
MTMPLASPSALTIASAIGSVCPDFSPCPLPTATRRPETAPTYPRCEHRPDDAFRCVSCSPGIASPSRACPGAERAPSTSLPHALPSPSCEFCGLAMYGSSFFPNKCRMTRRYPESMEDPNVTDLPPVSPGNGYVVHHVAHAGAPHAECLARHALTSCASVFMVALPSRRGGASVDGTGNLVRALTLFGRTELNWEFSRRKRDPKAAFLHR